MKPSELARVDAAVARANAKLAASNPNPKAKLVILGMGKKEPEPESKVQRRVLSAEETESMPPPGLICSARLP